MQLLLCFANFLLLPPLHAGDCSNKKKQALERIDLTDVAKFASRLGSLEAPKGRLDGRLDRFLQ